MQGMVTVLVIVASDPSLGLVETVLVELEIPEVMVDNLLIGLELYPFELFWTELVAPGWIAPDLVQGAIKVAGILKTPVFLEIATVETISVLVPHSVPVGAS